MNDRDTSTNHGDGRHTTRPQPREQLLMGWMAGGMMTTTEDRDGDDDHDDDDGSISPSTPHDNE
jgi:hypothetical protein